MIQTQKYICLGHQLFGEQKLCRRERVARTMFSFCLIKCVRSCLVDLVRDAYQWRRAPMMEFVELVHKRVLSLVSTYIYIGLHNTHTIHAVAYLKNESKGTGSKNIIK
jgi:hypothetical protein